MGTGAGQFRLAGVGRPAGGGPFPHDLSGDVPVGGGSQEHDEPGDVGGRGQPSAGDPPGDALQDLGRRGLAHPLGEGEAGGDDIDQNAFSAQLPGQAAGEPDEPSLIFEVKQPQSTRGHLESPGAGAWVASTPSR